MIKRGDLVEIKSAGEILATLDENGTLEELPFMPDMLKAIGKRFIVERKVEHFTFDGAATLQGESAVREFKGSNVFVFKGMRCSGGLCDGCGRSCKIFWKEEWLKPVDKCETLPTKYPNSDSSSLERRLKTRDINDTYFCQSSQLHKATLHLTYPQRFIKLAKNILSRNYGFFEMLRNLTIWFWCRLRGKLYGTYPRGELKKTPKETLNLKPGELVEVKSLEDIRATLNEKGCNRGLHFSSDMIPYCGKKMRVKTRVDGIILEGIGKLRKLNDTVFLEDAFCDSATWAFGACPRDEYLYWREIWLKRVEP